MLLVGLLYVTQQLSLEACIAVSLVGLLIHLCRGVRLLVSVAAIIDKVPSLIYKRLLGLKNYITAEQAKQF